MLENKAIELLLAIDRTGSINKAAKDLGVTYKTAWKRLHKLQVETGMVLTVSEIGGSQGGGTILTEKARKLTNQINEIYKSNL
jgi:molybdate transport system regulatory protein